MASTTIPKLGLGSSTGLRSIPVIGLGTASNDKDSIPLKNAVLEAIKLGYTHFDTASVYGSEQGLGEAIAEALKLGLVASRDELFITSKLWITDNHPHLVLPSLKTSLGNLQLEYLDLYLIHSPISAKPGRAVFPTDEKDLMPMDFKSVWKAMEEYQRLGLTKSIGAKGASWGTNQVWDNQVLIDIARARGKTVAQVSLRWIYEQGASVVVKSYNKERLKENLDIFDWELTEDDLNKINLIPQNRTSLCEGFVSPENGPYKSLEEFWDGEI
ncbi:hypothetical protein CsatB_022296 [Cannabis sativa]